MERKVVLLSLGLLTATLTTTCHLYLSGPWLVGASIAGLVIVGGVLVALAKSGLSFPETGQTTRGGEFRAFPRVNSIWGFAYFLSAAMMFFGLLVLSDRYLSRREPMFPEAILEPAMVSLALGLALFSLSDHKRR